MFAVIANGEPPIYWQDPYWRQWEHDRAQNAADEALGIHKYQIKIPQAFYSSALITNVNSQVPLLQYEAVISSQWVISQDFPAAIYSFLIRWRIHFVSFPQPLLLQNSSFTCGSKSMDRGQLLISWRGKYRDWDTDKGLGAPCFNCHLCKMLFMTIGNIFTQILSHCVSYICISPISVEPQTTRLGKRNWAKEGILPQKVLVLSFIWDSHPPLAKPLRCSA